MKRVIALTLMGAALVSCAPGMTNPTASTPDGDRPLPAGETRVIDGNEVTLNTSSALIPGLTYPGNSYRVTRSAVLDGFMKSTFNDGAPYRCATMEHQLWFGADGQRMEALTTQRLKALGFATQDARKGQSARVAVSNGKVSYLMSWVFSNSVAGVSSCLIENL